MFAKLKKKIQEEGGASGGEGSPGPAHGGPGLASPIRRDSSNFSMFSPSKGHVRETQSDSGVSVSSSPISEDNAREQSTTKEEVLAMLVKRTEQAKKLEGKVSDLAAALKEKFRTIEKLETALERQQDGAAKRIQELNEQYQASRVKMSDQLTAALQRKEEETRLQVKGEFDKIQKENVDLQRKLREAMGYRDKFFKNEEANDEFQGLATQELAKVKHMLLNTQGDLNRSQDQLKEKSELLNAADKTVKELTNQVSSLQKQLDTLSQDREKESSSSKNHLVTIKSLSFENETAQKKIATSKKELAETRAALVKLEHSYSDLQNEHQKLGHDAELYRSKTTTALAEKDENISHLDERVATLEQRLKNGALSGDDRVKALELERKSLEGKLLEARQQLTEVKSTWSEKITQLEHQISHLNAKMVEDSEELENSEKSAQKMKENFQKQIEELHSKLDDAEKRALSNLELADEKEMILNRQTSSHMAEIEKYQSSTSEMEKGVREKVAVLENQLHTLQAGREMDKLQAQQKIANLQNTVDDYLEKEIENEKEITRSEDELRKLKSDVQQKEREIGILSQQLKLSQQKTEELRKTITAKEEELAKGQELIESMRVMNKQMQSESSQMNRDKDELMLRNAELSQQVEASRRAAQQEKQDLEAEVIEQHSHTESLERRLQEQTSQLTLVQQKLRDIDEKETAVRTEKESEQIIWLNQQMKDRDDQLAEKNKTIKMQQQRLTDLKKTLQKELKVQSLPNDVNSEPPKEPETTNSKPATIQADSPQTVNMVAPSFVSPSNFSNRGQPVVLDEEDNPMMEINFQYLRHVVLKFMLSREHEAVHLIKAVAVLLRFTREEQRLIKDTLEWKQSWFGHRPKLGKGQFSKTIPPSAY